MSGTTPPPPRPRVGGKVLFKGMVPPGRPCGGWGARDSRDSNCRTQFLNLNLKRNFIKQNCATFYLWDPQDDKSEQDLSTLFTFRGECIKSVAVIELFCCCALSSNNRMVFFTVVATVNSAHIRHVYILESLLLLITSCYSHSRTLAQPSWYRDTNPVEVKVQTISFF